MRVTLVRLPDALGSCLASWYDLFGYANRLVERRGGHEGFEVEAWVPGSPPPPRPDTVLLPARTFGTSLGGPVPAAPPGLAPVLRSWTAQGTLLGAVCAGVFCVAEAGLLDGDRATTHWSLAQEFRQRFPRVTLDADALVVETDGRILGGGMTAYFDVGLRLIARLSPQVARDCAAVFVLDPERRHQTPFAPTDLEADGNDPLLSRALEWARSRVVLDFGVGDWARALAVEKRTLERRAAVHWGMGPAERLRRVRLDRARALVLSGLGWDEVSRRCGYRDASAFRRHFLERFGQTPGEFRRRFGAPTPG